MAFAPMRPVSALFTAGSLSFSAGNGSAEGVLGTGCSIAVSSDPAGGGGIATGADAGR